MSVSFSELFNAGEFIARHLGSEEPERSAMLSELGFSDLEAFTKSVVPDAVRMSQPLELPAPMTETDALDKLKAHANNIEVKASYIGMGYHPTKLPAVIQRNLLENPGWYTAYTPYQAEISQGRLEALLNFQQVCIDLTGLPLAGASLLDEATAAAEAMSMAKRLSKLKTQQFFVDTRLLPQTIDVIKTRASWFGFELVFGTPDQVEAGVFGAIFALNSAEGDLQDLTGPISTVKDAGGITAVVSDLLALMLVKSPGSMGADIALGSTQRFGVPMGFGGPHAAYFAFTDKAKRSAPGRMIGVSKDAHGNMALRMALQTREQHIRREKATSNICTSQVLLANIAGMYAVYHGPKGLTRIANRVHALTSSFAALAEQHGLKPKHSCFFDTLTFSCDAQKVTSELAANGINVFQRSETELSLSFNECSSASEYSLLAKALLGVEAQLPAEASFALPKALLRTDKVLTHKVFNSYHTEHEMLRYLKRLENKDLAMNHSMISLGSCTMKLNATSEMLPVSWPEFSKVHPFAPKQQTQGYLDMIEELETQLKKITGFDAISMQPNSGAQGEYAGLLAIRRFHEANGDTNRNVCLIPKSAHGTNPATADMLGMKVVVVATDEDGNVDLTDLKAKISQYPDQVGALMITYPSTHGVFEESVRDMCELVHAAGGQVYMDGANMNAQVGLMQPAAVGADVLHMNLHKTFCIPHGGGGPGMGPIGMKAHLAPFISNHVVSSVPGAQSGMGAVSAAPFGSASILPITWMYITMMGAEGLTQATQNALLNANYVAHKLKDAFPVLYTGKNGHVAHECIIDLRPAKAQSGVTEADVAKRLMDYGFHSPTMSFPVPGTLMIEPTESESKAELDRFIEALTSIKAEIDLVAQGKWSLEDNPLTNAPHTQFELTGEWTHGYSKDQAVYPAEFVRTNKFWPSVKRVDDVYGDKNLICSCPSIDNYS